MLYRLTIRKQFFQLLLSIAFIFFANASSASEFRFIDVHLAGTHQAEYNLLTGESFTIDISATVSCSWRDISTSLKFYALNQEILGRPFEVNRHADYATLRREGDLLLRTRKFNFGCDETQLISARLYAPRDPGVYYVGGCMPTLRDPDGHVFSNSGTGSIFNCSAPLVLHVTQRPAPDLITFIDEVAPAKNEYRPGERVTMKVRVRNIGDGASRETRLHMRRSAFPYANAYNSAQVDVVNIPALQPGEDSIAQFQVLSPGQARTTYFVGCVDGSAFGEDSTLPGGYTEAEIWRDNNCSRAAEIRTTNSQLPSVYVETLQASQGIFAPSSNINFTANILNGENASFKGGYVVYQKKLKSRIFRRFNSDRPELNLLRTGELVKRNGFQINPGSSSQRFSINAPSVQGRYQYKMCISHGREIFGCGNPVELTVR